MIDPGLLFGCFMVVLGCMWWLRNILRNLIIDAEWNAEYHMDGLHKQIIDAHDRVANQNIRLNDLEGWNRAKLKDEMQLYRRVAKLEEFKTREVSVITNNIAELAKRVHSAPARGERGRFVKAKGD